MDKTAKIALILVLCVIGAIALLFMNPTLLSSSPGQKQLNISNLPDSFTLNVFIIESSSSGGSKTNLSLSFTDGAISGGWCRHDGERNHLPVVDECVLNPATPGWCSNYCESWWGSPPRTKDGIKKWIDDLGAMPLAECNFNSHTVVCYWFS